MNKTTEYAPGRGKSREGVSGAMRPSPSLDGNEESNRDALWDFTAYRNAPARFAQEVLGSTWWEAQAAIAEMVAQHKRVAVKAANGVGKTYLAADLVLWFLYCHRPSVVLTTAPTWRQVESLLWEEIRRRHQRVNARAEQDATRPKLEGNLLQTRLKIAEGHFAMGLSTDEPVRFQGFHAENLLVVLDEACGVPEEIWDAIEGICVGGNNKVLAISNPLAPTGRFYRLFKSPRWKTYTISALAHPNVGVGCWALGVGGKSALIPGAVTREAVEDRIADWCEEEEEEGEKGRKGEGEIPTPNAQHPTPDLDTFVWAGRRYRPNGLFRARVLGEFPHSGDDSLIALSWIETAMNAGSRQSGVGSSENADSPTPCILAVDVARFGSDETVFAVRRGDTVTRLQIYRELDTMEVAGRVKAMAETEGAEVVVVDEIGVGAGVVDRLHETGIAGLTPVHFGARPTTPRDAERFLNLRAQTYWALRERFKTGQIRLPQDETLTAQLANLRYGFTSDGKIQIESKDDMRRRGLPSPDRADALALLFCPTIVQGALLAVPLISWGPRHANERAVPVHWDEVSNW